MKILLPLCMVLVFPITAVADEGGTACPGQIALVEKHVVTDLVAPVMRKLYATLGCSMQTAAVPGRRGIKLFNHSQVDGELYRLTQVEQYYERQFVRSDEAILMLKNGLWMNPDVASVSEYPIGYLVGVMWQENQSQHFDSLSFHTHQEMFEAYSKGRLSGFLESEITVTDWANRRGFGSAGKPKLSRLIEEEPLYHYLGKEYAPFMKKLSDLLRQRNPFSNL